MNTVVALYIIYVDRKKKKNDTKGERNNVATGKERKIWRFSLMIFMSVSWLFILNFGVFSICIPFGGHFGQKNWLYIRFGVGGLVKGREK